ncbi:hypothetical protein [Streptomyces mobaraensis]|uniref:Uncharacterized protein n=3 Tax=Streptomyces mobaraensis TaxID=35621 RepID=A0A5N5VYD6_STRMB|nr:hypothetical protein [Streptomyces mobaraensis]EME99974.1 hypothetical protein H340_13876 [Streptomyces mobaraensis NBRC 13819 = DSM 40847]KAB7833860.1 hypothetical protein FRZ00_32035 [Streptomyces mobaraensis]
MGGNGMDGCETGRWTMLWWGWLIIAAVGLLVVAGTLAGVQARRRAGTVIVVRRGHRAGRGGTRWTR